MLFGLSCDRFSLTSISLKGCFSVVRCYRSLDQQGPTVVNASADKFHPLKASIFRFWLLRIPPAPPEIEVFNKSGHLALVVRQRKDEQEK